MSAAALLPARAVEAPLRPRGRLYGVALRGDRLDEPLLAHTVASSCTWITPELDWNWDALEYQRGRW